LILAYSVSSRANRPVITYRDRDGQASICRPAFHRLHVAVFRRAVS